MQKARRSCAGLICFSGDRNGQSKLLSPVVVPVDSCLRDSVTAHALIPLFSRPWPLLQLELAQFWAHFQIAFLFRRDYLAELASPAFVSHSAFVQRLARKGSE